MFSTKARILLSARFGAQFSSSLCPSSSRSLRDFSLHHPNPLALTSVLPGNHQSPASSYHQKTLPRRALSSSSSTSASTPSSTSTVPSSLPIRTAPESLPRLEQSWWKSLYDNRISFYEIHNRKRLAEQLFLAASYQASNPLWYGPGDIPRNFRNRHALLCLHIWMIHKRLISDTYNPTWALLVQEELFSILWEDTTSRVRHQGVNEWAVNKNVLQVQQYTWLHLTHYDHVYTEFLDYPQNRMQELKRLIARHILVDPHEIPQQQQAASNDANTNNTTTKYEQSLKYLDRLVASKSSDQLNRLAWYIDEQYQNIVLDWPDEDYRQGRLVWTNLPDFTNMKKKKPKKSVEKPPHLEQASHAPPPSTATTSSSTTTIEQDDVVPPPWVRHMTLKGQVYYWNVDTMESTWTKPALDAQHVKQHSYPWLTVDSTTRPPFVQS